MRNNWVFFGSCAGEAIWSTVVENCAVILNGAREAMLRSPEISESMVDDAIRSLREWSTRPDAALWYAIALAEGVRP